MNDSTPSPRRRKSTGKRLRFEVFKRDYFTCQYCGAQPPDVVLVVDHITPVAAGGETTVDNLITACTTCNQGKADKLLTTRQVRPDADLLLLETQQEIAELQRFQEAKAARDAALLECVESIVGTWCEYTGWYSASATFQRALKSLITQHDPYLIDDAVRITAIAVKTGRIPERQDAYLPYLYAVVRNSAAEREEN